MAVHCSTNLPEATPLNKTAYLSLPWKWGPIHSSCARGEGWWTSTALEHALAWYCGGSHSFCEYLSTETCPVLPRDTLSFRLPYLQLARSFCASCSYQYLVCVISDGIECWNHSKLECQDAFFFPLWVFLNSSRGRSCYQFPEVYCKYINLFYCLVFLLWLKRIARNRLMNLVCVCVLVVWREGFVCNLDWLCSHNPYSLASWVLGYQSEINFTALGKLTWDIKLYFEPSSLL